MSSLGKRKAGPFTGHDQKPRGYSQPSRAVGRGLPAAGGMIKRKQREEKKCVDVGAGTLTGVISTLFTPFLLNGTKQGNSVAQRIGNRFNMHSVHITGHVFPNAQGNAQPEYLRIMVVYDRQSNKGTLLDTDLLQDLDVNGNAIADTSFAHINIANADRFIMLRDLRFAIGNNSNLTFTNADSATIDYNGKYNFNEYIRLNGLETQCQTSTGLFGDITSGALWLITLGQRAPGPLGAGYTFQATARLRYFDS